MESKLSFQQMEIVALAQHHNPTVLNHDFLMRKGIVKDDWGWKLARPPYSTPVASGVSYNSGISISAQGQRIVFSENNSRAIPELTPIGEIALGYLKALPDMDCVAIGTNPKAHLVVEHLAVARELIMGRLLKDGPWRHFGDEPVAGGVRFIYRVLDARFVLSVDVGRIAVGKQDQKPCVLLQGNLHRDITGEDSEAKARALEPVVRNWRRDYEKFLEVSEALLAEQ